MVCRSPQRYGVPTGFSSVRLSYGECDTTRIHAISEVNVKQVKKDSVVTLDRCCLGAAEIRRDEERVREVIQHKELPNKQ